MTQIKLQRMIVHFYKSLKNKLCKLVNRTQNCRAYFNVIIESYHRKCRESHFLRIYSFPFQREEFKFQVNLNLNLSPNLNSCCTISHIMKVIIFKVKFNCFIKVQFIALRNTEVKRERSKVLLYHKTIIR